MSSRRFDQGVIDPELLILTGLSLVLFGLGWKWSR